MFVGQQWVTSEFWQNTLALRVKKNEQKENLQQNRSVWVFGTGFRHVIDGKVYLTTATHVVSDFLSIEILVGNKWQKYPFQLVGTDGDIAVLAGEDWLGKLRHEIEPTSNGIIFSQQVYFLGFPFGWYCTEPNNNDLPLPIVKGAIFSGFLPNREPKTMILDAMSNQGFSGGPVTFTCKDGKHKLAGIISARQNEEINISKGLWAEEFERPKQNAGFVFAIDISAAVKIARKNPIGHLNK